MNQELELRQKREKEKKKVVRENQPNLAKDSYPYVKQRHTEE